VLMRLLLMWNLRSVAAAPDLRPTGPSGGQARPTTIRLAASCSDPIGRPDPRSDWPPPRPYRDGAATTGGDPTGRPGPDPIGRPQADPVGCLHPDPLARLVTRIEALLRNRAFVVAYADARARWQNGTAAMFPPGTYWLQRFASVPILET
jgi:hypothetical protein